MVYEDYELANPNASSLMQSLRAFGYDISTAIADLIDNSITAQSNLVYVVFEWNEGEPWIAVADNGHGMSESELFEAMKTGSKNPLDTRDSDDLGRFGLGLKTASFSQCKKLTVATRNSIGNVHVRCWDLDIVTSENAWILLKSASPKANKLISEYFNKCGSGTIVIWEKLDRIVPGTSCNDEDYQKAFLSYAQSVKNHISVVFSSYMSGLKKVQFFLNGRPIQMWDPFMTDNFFTTKLPTERLYVNGHEVIVKPYILPHHSKLSAIEFEKNAGQLGWTAQQGFYVFRNNRLLVAGDWLIPEMRKLEQYRLARIRVDIGNETDTEWNIDVKKSIAIPPISLQKEIKRIAIIAQKESSKIYRHRGKILARKNQENAFVWEQNVRNGKIGYKISRSHPIIKNLLKSASGPQIKMLLNLIEETVPVPMIISDYSEKSKEMLNPFEGRKSDNLDEMISTLYDVYLSHGCSPQEAVQNIASTEPYVYMPEKVALFCEREGIKIG